ncbi:WD40-repeat-containing domain protein, partial [Dichomitus squalens]
VATASDDSTIILWDARAACISREWFAHDEQVKSLAFSPDSRYIASAGGKNVAIWDISGSLHQADGTGDNPSAAAFSRSSTHLAVGYAGGFIHIWDMEKRQEPLRWEAHKCWIRDVAFSPDGQLLLSASDDRTVKTWDAHTGSMLKVFHGHEWWVLEACFSPCGKYIASVSNRTVRVWRTSDGSCLATLSDHGDFILCVAYTPDGTMLWSAADNGTRTVLDHTTSECPAT